jgi:geranylgeranyl reductase family protein
METYDVLIVGGGPAGSTCGWKLRQAGLNVLILDKAVFPRDKTCAGWITPQVIESLDLDAADYARDHVFQPITSFQVSLLGRTAVEIPFPSPVSFGIRRCEFDHYLLQRSGAECRLGEKLESLERFSDGWVINGRYQAPLLVGAGGHFCPVARYLKEQSAAVRPGPPLVTAVETEFPLESLHGQTCATGDCPRLYFCSDLSGYGWCVRKGDYLNIGIGLINSRETSSRLPGLLDVLKQEGSFEAEIPGKFHGHAYHLYDGTEKIADHGWLLIGDAAGLAYPQSGEGIRPAIESGLMAASTILRARKNYELEHLAPYERLIRARFGKPARMDAGRWAAMIPEGWRRAGAGMLLSNCWFVSRVVIKRWFLHAEQPAWRADNSDLSC